MISVVGSSTSNWPSKSRNSTNSCFVYIEASSNTYSSWAESYQTLVPGSFRARKHASQHFRLGADVAGQKVAVDKMQQPQLTFNPRCQPCFAPQVEQIPQPSSLLLRRRGHPDANAEICKTTLGSERKQCNLDAQRSLRLLSRQSQNRARVPSQ